MDEKELDRLNQLSDQLEDILRPIQISAYNTPVNEAEEKQKFFSAYFDQKRYDPQFQYRETPVGWEEELVLFLRTLEPSNNHWEHLLFEEVVRTIQQLETLASHDAGKITSDSVYAYGMPSESLVRRAEEIVGSLKEESEDSNHVSAEDAAKYMQRALNELDNHWRVILTEDINARTMVRSTEKTVNIRKNALYSHSSLKRVLIHEIGTHVFRYQNGSVQPFRLLRLGLLGYLATEEGLATYHEMKFGVQDDGAQYRYALRTLAAYQCLHQSFHDIFKYLMRFTSRNDAFSIAKRAKRGFVDTSQYGGDVKDKLYLEGFLKVSEHLASRPEDYLLLMAGKTSVEMIQELHELKEQDLITAPKYLPDILLSLS